MSARKNSSPAREPRPRLIPTGNCWHCGAAVPAGKFFCRGHDKSAVAAVIAEVYGSTVEFLVEHGRGPK